ncbi:hypothetical protein IVA82_45670 [Bradyrhizobium sp. 142]|nr:hypothetical protein [Bradyrhizobium sp. 142]
MNIVMVLSIVLRIKRTLDGVEIDKIISDVETEKALAAEHRQRADRRKAELGAKSFSADVLEPAMPRPSELRLRGSILCLPDGLLCSFDLGWNLYFHIATMVNACSIKFRGCSRNGDICYAFCQS